LSQHQGDLENTATFEEYRKTLELYRKIYTHRPKAIVIDRHPEYLSSKLGRAEASARQLELIQVQHHHAHVAACLAENGYALDAPPVLGIVLDGLGLGDDGTFWGGEFLLADYRGYRRLARLKPVAMPGGAQAIREPWRNLYAHLSQADLMEHFELLGLDAYLDGGRRALIDAMIEKQINAPPASSCGRLFDAVAAALGICGDRQDYEGEAAARLEALAATAASLRGGGDDAYPFALSEAGDNLLEIDPAPMWSALLCDHVGGVAPATIAHRFHQSLAKIMAETAAQLALRTTSPGFETVALSGGCFQNRILFESMTAQLRQAGFVVLTQVEVPANDGGLSLGQASVAAAQMLGGATISC
jgi:hydrogenase maturation protein HypF